MNWLDVLFIFIFGVLYVVFIWTSNMYYLYVLVVCTSCRY